jgi:hypothetical protein
MEMKRLLLCRTAWMRNYQGLKGDKPKGSSAYIKKYGSGHEVYNFLPSGDRMYGYVEFRGSLDLSRYRVCLVTSALTHPKLHAFQWDPEVGKWTSDDDRTLLFEERTAACVWVG